jgi:hypothetical protein
MQQWLNLLPMAGALLNLSAAMTNLAITIINRRGTTSDRVDNDIARQPPAKSVPARGVGVGTDAADIRRAPSQPPSGTATTS